MADSNTTNPFDPDSQGNLPQSGDKSSPSGSGASHGSGSSNLDENGQPKLKLKKILTPLSPHLSSPRPQVEQGLPHKESRLEIPRAVPIDIEPDLPPPPPEQKLTAPTGPGFDQPLPGPADHLPYGEVQSPPEETPEQDADGAEEAEEAEPASPAAKPNPVQSSSVRRIAILLAPVVLIIVALFIVNFLFDPFGLKVEPIKPLTSPTLGNQISRAEQNEAPAAVGGIDLYVMLDKLSLEDYLQALRKQKIFPSQNPDGIFIGAAFVPVGKAVNPSFGLSLKGIEKSEAVLVDEKLTEYRLPLL